MKLAFVDGIYLTLIISFSLLGGIFCAKWKNSISNLYLGIILLLFGYAVFCRFLENNGLILHMPHFIETDFALFFLTPPLFLIYTKSYAMYQKVQNRTILIHCIPTILVITFLTPFFLSSGVEKITYFQTDAQSSFSTKYLILNTLFFNYSVAYLIYILVISIKYMRKLPGNKSKTEINWIIYFTIVMLSLQFIAVLFLVFGEEEKRFNYLPVTLFIALLALMTKAVLGSDLVKSSNIFKPNPSALDIKEAKTIATKIASLVEDKELFRNTDISLNALAEEVAIPGYKLSRAINTHFNKNFFDFINGYRVSEAKKKLTDHNYQNFTIEAVGSEVGFKSKSSFFSAFKKETSMTPNEYKISKYTDNQIVK